MPGSDIQCMKCRKPAATFIRYSGAHLCAEHFQEFFLKRVKKEIRQQGVLKDGGRIAVAVSGGKDSLVALTTLSRVAAEHKGVKLEAVIVDEGIAGYRPSSIEIARRVCSELEVPLRETGFREAAGFDLDEIVKGVDGVNPCAICGVFRRYALNNAAREMRAVRIATGHNLDDLAQSVLMNVLGSDMDKLFRLGPHTREIPGLVPRVYPLRTIPEKEVLLYALLTGVPLHGRECPYSEHATRGKYRDILSRLECQTPGTRHSLLTFHEDLMRLRPGRADEPRNLVCSSCKEPSAAQVCKRCAYLELIRSALGPGTEDLPV